MPAFLLLEFRARLHNASKENSGGWNGGHYQVVLSTHAHILSFYLHNLLHCPIWAHADGLIKKHICPSWLYLSLAVQCHATNCHVRPPPTVTEMPALQRKHIYRSLGITLFSNNIVIQTTTKAIRLLTTGGWWDLIQSMHVTIKHLNMVRQVGPSTTQLPHAKAKHIFYMHPGTHLVELLGSTRKICC